MAKSIQTKQLQRHFCGSTTSGKKHNAGENDEVTAGDNNNNNNVNYDYVFENFNDG